MSLVLEDIASMALHFSHGTVEMFIQHVGADNFISDLEIRSHQRQDWTPSRLELVANVSWKSIGLELAKWSDGCVDHFAFE